MKSSTICSKGRIAGSLFTISILIQGTSTHKPYSLEFRTSETELVTAQPIILFEGILSLYEKRFRDLMDLKIFVLTDDDVRLARRCNNKLANELL